MASAALAALAFTTAPAAADGPGGYGYGTPPAGTATAASASGTLEHRSSALLGRTLTVRGSIAGAAPGQTIELQRQDVLGAWAPATTTTAGQDGAFVARWRTDPLGSVVLRAVPVGDGGASAASTAPTTKLTVFKPAQATWYGPGFYGRKTACGQTMSKKLLGVANKKLPCGSMVHLYVKGQTITVPVVDRGPFHRGVSYDLTKATADAVGFTGKGSIGVLRGAPTP